MTRRLCLIGGTLPLMWWWWWWCTWQYCSVLLRDLAFLGRLLSSRTSSNCLTQNHTEGVILTKAAGREIYSLVLMSKCSEKNLTFTRSENEAVCTSQGDRRCAQRAQHGRRQRRCAEPRGCSRQDVPDWDGTTVQTNQGQSREKRSPLSRAR